MSSVWQCPVHGEVLPFHAPAHVNREMLTSVAGQVAVPLWAPWPLLPHWTITGVGWSGDNRNPGRATALACAGPAPSGGVADLVLVCEEPGVGLGGRFAGIQSVDPGPMLVAATGSAAHAKIQVAGHPTPLWSVGGAPGRSVYVGEAMGLWLWAVGWPEEAGWVLADHVELVDLRDEVPTELVYGALSPYLNG
jgi:hypothetical protein